jgi:hypothetical protein
MHRAKRWFSKALLAGALVGVALFGCRRAPRLDLPEHIVLIVADALRPDHLGCYGYAGDVSPNIDRLAARGPENAYSNAP